MSHTYMGVEYKFYMGTETLHCFVLGYHTFGNGSGVVLYNLP